MTFAIAIATDGCGLSYEMCCEFRPAKEEQGNIVYVVPFTVEGIQPVVATLQ